MLQKEKQCKHSHDLPMEDIPQTQWNQDNSDYLGFKWGKWFARIFTKLVGNAGMIGLKIKSCQLEE